MDEHLSGLIRRSGGWIGFDEFMTEALYAPGLGYYAQDSIKFGTLPAGAGASPGSDFVTAPELSDLFGQSLAQQVAQALEQSATAQIWEFGAGSGRLALQLLQALQAAGLALPQYRIVELSAHLRLRQQATLAAFSDRVSWLDSLPAQFAGVVIGNEVLDAMPVKLLVRRAGRWQERGVALDDAAPPDAPIFCWEDRPTGLCPPLDVAGDHDYLTEVHPQAEAFVRTLGERLSAGAVFFIDYGFPAAEYYHAQRHMGTVMCHHQHRSDPDPLSQVGQKDISAHVNFTGIALAGNEVGLDVLGYSSQARFLLNCGLAQQLEKVDWASRVAAQKLVMEHEMGELFKVIGFCKGRPWQAMGFSLGDRTHTL